MKTLIVMRPEDTVGNAIEDICAGDEIACTVGDVTHTFTARTDIPFGFKGAVQAMAEGSDVIKYNEVIGVASQTIQVGECVHVHNISGKRGRGDLAGGVA